MPAGHVASESSQDENFSTGVHGLGGADISASDTDSNMAALMAPPRHPFPTMYGALKESICESSVPNLQSMSRDETTGTRRRKELVTRRYDDSQTTGYKQKSSARHHPLFKLITRIVLATHLLQQQATEPDMEMVKILQTHVDEVDNFLEKISEDLDLAIINVEERIHFLSLLMTNPDVFGAMLEDKRSRTQLMEGNEKVETIIERTSKAMDAALLDVRIGRAATRELGRQLSATSHEWPSRESSLEAVLDSMRGNEQGWKHCLKELQHKAHVLRGNLDQLSTVIREMARTAAAAVMRKRLHGGAASSGQRQMLTIPRSRFSRDNQRERALSLDKALPEAPINTTDAVELECHPVHREQISKELRHTRASLTDVKLPNVPRQSIVPPRSAPSSSRVTLSDSRDIGTNDTGDYTKSLEEAEEPSPLESHPSGEGVRPVDAGNAKRQRAIDVVEHARSLSKSDGDSRPRTSDGNTELPLYHRGSTSRSSRTGPVCERSNHGPPPTGNRDYTRSTSLINLIRNFSFHSITSS